MKIFPVESPGYLFFGRLSKIIRLHPVVGAIIPFLFMLTLLFSSCDMMGGSIEDFIEYNTGNARVVDFKITSIAPEFLIKTRKAWIQDPSNTVQSAAGMITFEVTIDNPQQYDLIVTPVITEFIGNDWKKVSSPANRPIKAFSVPGRPNTIKIQIGDDSNPEYTLDQGDSFKVRLDIATKDGKRVFEPYTKIPQIIYDTRLKAAVDPKPEDSNDPDYKHVVTWTTQNDGEHKGINRISVTLSSRSDSASIRPFEYVLEDGSWVLANKYEIPGSGYYSNLRQTTTVGQPTKFELPFPFIGGSYTDDDDFLEDFVIVVTLWDKNGLNATAGRGGHPATYLEDLSIWYLHRGESTYRKSDWALKNKDIVSYSLTVPNSVERVMFRAEKSLEYPDQVVRWGGGTNDEPEKSFPLPVGPKAFVMEVFWKNPENLSDEEDPDPMQYTFTVSRLNPNKDSTIKDLIIKAGPSSLSLAECAIIGGFDEPDDNKINNGTLKTAYTVYVPPNTAVVQVVGEYLNTSEIYNYKGRPDGKPTLGTIPLPGSSNFYIEKIGSDIPYKDYYDYSDADDSAYLDKSPLFFITNGWNYTLSNFKDGGGPGVYTFYLYVKSEFDLNEASSRCYVITVIKTDPLGNPNAKINNLSVISDQESGNAKVLLKDNEPSIVNQFYPEVLSYTVNVPSGALAVDFSVTPIANAEIREITCTYYTTSNSSGSNTISCPIPVTKLTSFNIPWSEANLTKKLVTLTVYSEGVDSTPRNYAITLIKNIPGLNNAPTLASGKGSLTVEWFNTTSGGGSSNLPSVYELYYCDNDFSNFPELAWKAGKDISAGSSGSKITSTISGLDDGSKYNVWVRPKNSSGIPGDWRLAQTPQSPGPAWDYGIPGAPEITGFTYDPPSGDYNLIEDSVSSTKNSYTLTVPNSTTSITITPKKEAWVICDKASVPLSVAGGSLPEGAATSDSTIAFKASSPDGVIPKQYEIKVFRLLGKPGNVVPDPFDGAVKLTWAPVSGDTYDVYYSTSSTLNENTALKIHGITGISTTVASLTNGNTYYFWVRGVKGGIPGEWSSSVSEMPRGTINYLNGIGISPSVTSPGTPLSPDFTAENSSYTVILPPTTVGITITPSPGQANQSFSYLPVGNTVNPGYGGKIEKKITVTPDNTINGIAREYNLTVYRMPATPAAPTVHSRNGGVEVSWTNSTSGAEYYEVWHGVTDVFSQATKLPQDFHALSPQLSTTITGLPNDGTSHYVWLRARSVDGIEGSPSASGSAIPAEVSLDELTVNGVPITLLPGVTSYSKSVPYSPSFIVVGATAPAGVSITGTGSYNLALGLNSIYVTATSASGAEITYTIKVTRENPSPNTNLNSVTVEYDIGNGPVTEEAFPSGGMTATVDAATEEIIVKAIPDFAGATVIGDGLYSFVLSLSRMDIYLYVISESGSYKSYVLTVFRGT